MRFLSILLLLSACGAANLATVVQLSRVNPLTADPAGFVATVVLPHELDLREGSALLGLTWVSETEEIGGHFPLQQYRALEGSGIVTSDTQRVVFFTLSAKDTANIRQVQRAISDRKERGIDGEGSFSVFATPCLRGAPAVAEISTYLRVEAGGAFLPLLQNFDIRQEISEGQFAELAACG